MTPRARRALRRLDITGVTADSRKVKKGDLFVAVPGTKADGSQFVAQALAAGAAAAIAEQRAGRTCRPMRRS